MTAEVEQHHAEVPEASLQAQEPVAASGTLDQRQQDLLRRGRLRIPPKANTLSAPSRTPVPVKPNTIGAKRRVCSSDADVVFGFRSTGGVWRRSLAQ